MTTHANYGLTFVNEEFAGGAFKSIQWLDNSSLELASFLVFIKSDPDLILSYYIPQIEGILSQGGELSIVYGSSNALVGQLNTVLSYQNNLDYEKVVPTTEFREIILEWYNFLISDQS
jgi:hypothetical protein